jgi:hypothetical protein
MKKKVAESKETSISPCKDTPAMTHIEARVEPDGNLHRL